MRSSTLSGYSLSLALLLWTHAAAAQQQIGTPLRLHQQAEHGERFMGIRLRGALALSGDEALAEISDLAWDEDEQILYAVTDRGRLLHLAPIIHDDRLISVELLADHRLRDTRGRALEGANADAEGLTLRNGDNGISGDSVLAVSFEHRYRILLFSPRGKQTGKLRLPDDLRDPRFYRRRNNGLEAVAFHPRLGYLSGPEKPRGGDSIPIYSIDRGWQWRYPLATNYGALVALEYFDDGRILVLERAYRSLFDPLIVTLSLLSIGEHNRDQPLTAQPVARFDSTEGWLTQNLEGLARHHGRRFFMVSDDNGEPYLQTQLLYFEVLVD